MIAKVACLCLALCVTQTAQGQCTAVDNINAPETVSWSNQLIRALANENSCSQISSDDSFAASHACNLFAGRVLETIYGVRDFEPAHPNPDQPYLQANDIGTELQAGILAGWSLVGTGDNQESLNQAHEYAQQHKLVVAVFVNASGLGHIALIGPGPMTRSGGWGLSTPVSASFFIGKPLKQFFGLPLACAFQKNIRSSVKIWVKDRSS